MHSRPRLLLRAIFGEHTAASRRQLPISVGNAAMAKIVKRSIVLAGHKTSVSLEEAFWVALKEIAQRERMTVSTLVEQIDAAREGNLSSAVRMFVLDDFRRRATERLGPLGKSTEPMDCDPPN